MTVRCWTTNYLTNFTASAYLNGILVKERTADAAASGGNSDSGSRASYYFLDANPIGNAWEVPPNVTSLLPQRNVDDCVPSNAIAVAIHFANWAGSYWQSCCTYTWATNSDAQSFIRDSLTRGGFGAAGDGGITHVVPFVIGQGKRMAFANTDAAASYWCTWQEGFAVGR
jgi:hypothetical protein